jgi:hypothetical protein
MARKKQSAPPAQSVRLRVAVEATESTPAYYANYLEVAISANEFALSAVRVPTKPNQAVIQSGELRLEPAVQLLIPPTVVPGLIRALTTQRNNYESQFGPIKDTGALEE